jgi:hypothetical protein
MLTHPETMLLHGQLRRWLVGVGQGPNGGNLRVDGMQQPILVHSGRVWHGVTCSSAALYERGASSRSWFASAQSLHCSRNQHPQDCNPLSALSCMLHQNSDLIIQYKLHLLLTNAQGWSPGLRHGADAARAWQLAPHLSINSLPTIAYRAAAYQASMCLQESFVSTQRVQASCPSGVRQRVRLPGSPPQNL